MANRANNTFRGLTILAFDLILFFALLNWLPFSQQENRGLALLVFVGVLWLAIFGYCD